MQIELKNLSFVRHAKSSWENPGLADIDRPLNKRGNRDAPFMAEQMKTLGNIPDLILTSPAVRARTTAMIFADKFEMSMDDFIVEDRLYGAFPDDIVEIVQEASDSYESIFVFGHNPTMTDLANRFAGISVDNVPTCGVFQVKTMVEHWADWSPAVSAFVGFYYPKQYAELRNK